MASRFIVRGVKCSCGRVTVAPGALLRGSDAPDRPQSFSSFSPLPRCAPSGSCRLCRAFALPGVPGRAAAHPAHAVLAGSHLATGFGGAYVRGTSPHSRAWAGPGGYRLPFPCRPISAPSRSASAHGGAPSAPSNSALQRTCRQSPLAPSSAPLSAVSLGA